MRRAWPAVAALLLTACGSPSGAWVVTHPPPLAYDSPPAVTVLPDGNVMVAGGLFFGDAVPDAFVYQTRQQVWQPTASMPVAREGFASAPLPGGGLLVAGGILHPRTAPTYLATADVLAPPADWQEVPTPAPLEDMTAVPLRDGRVLLLGGTGAGGPAAAAWLFDPVARTFAVLPPMSTASVAPAAAELADGRVLVTSPGSAEILGPASRTWVGAPAAPSRDPQQLLAALPGGSVLLVTSRPGPALLTSCYVLPSRDAAWRATGCVPPSLLPAALLVVDGVARIVGFDLSSGTVVVDSYDAQQRTWRLGPPLAGGRPAVAATVLAGGRLLVITPDVYGIFDPNAEAYPGIGGPIASMQVTVFEGLAAALLLLLLGLRWWRSAAERRLGGAGDLV